jgi:hypothetical protein
MPPSKTRTRARSATKSRRKSPAAGTNQPRLNEQTRQLEQPSNPFRELFQGAIPPSALHQAAREAARQEGWVPPGDHEDQTAKRRKAGKSSGASRSGRSQMRRSLVMLARDLLSPELRLTPYAEGAIEALRHKYDQLLSKGSDDPDPIISGIHSALSENDRKWLKKASDETLKKDLQAIRRMRGVTR